MAKLSVDKAILKAKSHAKKGEIAEAQKLYQAVLQAFPKNKRAQQGLAALNKPKQPTATQGPPQDKINQLINLYNQGQLTAVVEQAQALTEQYPEAFMIWNILGAANNGLGRVQAASEAFKKVTELNPAYADGFNNLGITLKNQGKLDEAIASYNQALSLKPDYAEAYNNMGVALQDQGKLDEAIGAYNEALSLTPDYAEAYNNMGVTLQDQGKLDEAIASYNQALSLKPDYAEAYDNMGNTLQDQGKLDEAIASYNKAISLKPDYAEAHRNLSTSVKYQPEDTQISLVNDMIQRSDLEDEDRCHLHYTFAKMKEDLGDLDAAYENYVAGGKLRQKLLSYDFKQDELIFDQIKNTAPKLKEFVFSKPMETAVNTPIFILGMPRSGTTLVEQIISSHSQVHGAGELPFLGCFGCTLSHGNQTVNSDNLLQIRNAYLNELNKVSNDCPFVTDKMPQNFQHIGLLLQALPEAKVIHVKRDPAATCWSNFKHYFLKGLGYSYDLTDTVGYFKLYQDLMAFWDQHYGSKIYHLDYDRLTIEQEIETRKLIEHLELGWEDACLSPQDNKRSVSTASQQQVREKVYTGSSQAWRKFEPYLNGAFDELLT
ncbi:tetratricopeptide repeat protein [Rhodobacteraceae bacterium]|nr:tetratricopeptide repeat protein [Paracoccaceae bacterium]